MTLCVIHQHPKVLLAMKKRGFGQGRWNGLGGKVQDGETIEQAANREAFEEANIKLGELQKMGVIEFSWKTKPDILQVHIFKAESFWGIPTETEEMKPAWFDVNQIPYSKMWQDDIYWMPLFLENQKFLGKFVFDDQDNILEKELNEVKEI
ncbi:MAG: 8-oxo-dGTP diphosphatase [Candidatus Pacebacteria bacterium]|nr:8-oxo-dGTP diphosphatase [Candidatus Paceibacterota bacterium]